jgi:hypothetical protein
MTNFDSHGILILRLTRRLTSDLHRLLSPPIGQLSRIRLAPAPFSPPLPVVNFRSRPDLASPDEPSMSIQPPPSIAPPDTLAVNLRLSPSAHSCSAVCSASPACAGFCICGLDQSAPLQLALLIRFLVRLASEPPNRFGGPILQPIRQSNPDSLPGHQLKETVRPFDLWMQV